VDEKVKPENEESVNNVKRKNLNERLGNLTYQMAKMRQKLNELAKEANGIGAELEKLDGK
jgi:regulator of replication initiation timing